MSMAEMMIDRLLVFLDLVVGLKIYPRGRDDNAKLSMSET